MPWITQIPIAEASGLLKKQFDAALKRAGRVWHIIHIVSLNPEATRARITFCSAIMMGESPLTRSSAKCWPPSSPPNSTAIIEHRRTRTISVKRSEKYRATAHTMYFYDDIGTQNSLMISKPMWRDYVRPYHVKLIELAHRYGKPVMYHTERPLQM